MYDKTRQDTYEIEALSTFHASGDVCPDADDQYMHPKFQKKMFQNV